MRYAMVVIALLGLAGGLTGCASSQDADHPPPATNSTPEQDQENIRNILRERPN